MRNIQTLTMDINKKCTQIVTANTGEAGTRFIRVSIIDNGLPFDLEGLSVLIYAKKTDGTKVFNDVTIEDPKNGVVLAELTSQILAIEGLVKLTLLLREGQKKLATKVFNLKVDESPIDEDAIESSNEFGALTGALSKVDEWNGYFDENSGKIEEKYTERLNKVSSDLETKANLNDVNSKVWNMANMGQDVKEAMTGGSVAVVGKNTILAENIVNRQVTPSKTSFCDVGVNKFNIDAVRFGIFADPRSGKIVESSNPNYYTVKFDVLPNNQYLYGSLNTVKDAYVKISGGFISFLDVNMNLLNYITGYETEYLEVPSNCYYIIHSIYSTQNYDTLKAKEPMFVVKDYFNSISNMFGNFIPFKYKLNQQVVEVENDISYVDNLESSNSSVGLSANMGRELNEKIKNLSISTDSDWKNKIGITYGDSITAINNPESPTGLWGTQGEYASWGHYVKQYLGMTKLYGRGVGGQTYSWRTNGGSVAFANNSDGSLHSRDDNFNYDNYTGVIPNGTTKIRGAFCSWSRITGMIPQSIKDSIDFIFVMGGSNDIPGDGTPIGNHTFVKGNEIDIEWKNSSYYNGGDFDVSTYIGGMCSTIMKLQSWCPNAVIIVGTPPNGRASSNPNANETTWCKNSLGLYYNDYVKEQEVVLKDFGIPCIDVYGTAGINPFNRATYITDWVHPYSDKGCRALARTVIGGLKGIMPNM